jgi:gamma-glutamyltranspeptidase/glutathione hydrolase
MVSAPHHLAAHAGHRVLADGGNAVEAIVAAAAMIAVAYPHMNGLGGDNFWLIRGSDGNIEAIEACGPSAAAASAEAYLSQGLTEIPSRGPLAALTVAGAVAGWASALETSARWGGRLGLPRLLEDAITYAREGVPVSKSQSLLTAAKLGELKDLHGFAPTYLGASGSALNRGANLAQPRLAVTLERLAEAGPDDFYRGDLARSVARDLELAGSPLALADLESYRARRVRPLSLSICSGRALNMPPPTQGLASLLILGIYERLRVEKADSFEFVHGMVEATKKAFQVRDTFITDPDYLSGDPAAFLADEWLDEQAGRIDMTKAKPWTRSSQPGDTVWLGAIDAEGRAVSFIQSIYWEYGSGIVLPETGITWQNRGTSFSLDPQDSNPLTPARRPFHTIQPAMAELADGRIMVYGCMGGDGQPQTQAAVYARYAIHGEELQAAVTAPRWLLGRTWGQTVAHLRLERRFDSAVIDALRRCGHDPEIVEPFSELMGHAGAVVARRDGLLEGASDPRSDGAALAL